MITGIDVKIGSNSVVNSVFFIILTFYLIFLVQGVMEETLFRDVIFKHEMLWLQDHYDTKYFGRFDNGHLFILLGGLLVISIPFWDNVLRGLASVIPLLTPVSDRVGSLSHPLGEYEGTSITFLEPYPLWIFYLVVGLILMAIANFIYSRHHTPMIGALLLASMIFGFAHFEDYRYVFFAAIAGFGYGYTYFKTKNLLASAMVHMGVDAIWSLLLSY